MERVRSEAGPRRHAIFRVCRPAAVEGNRLVLEVPANLTFHLAQLVEDRPLTAVIAAVAGELLGGQVVVAFRAGDGEGTTGRDASEPGILPEDGSPDEAGGRPSDPATVVAEILGGEVVSKG